MFEVSKLEFSKWLSQQNLSEMTEYEKTLLGIIVDHFDEIAKCGTTNGTRAKLLGKYINELDGKAERSTFSGLTTEAESKKIKRLSTLSVENFRGFNLPEEFDFSTQYTLYHGPNGSGKTSFCEALEYSALGTIAEASTRNIPLEKYIVNTVTGKKKATVPFLTCETTDGEKIRFPANLSAYRFAFVERNRIIDFSHMGATTAKNQSERIAMLFGLSEFQKFVRDFTDTFDGRYIKLDDDVLREFSERKRQYSERNGKYEDRRKELEPLTNEVESVLKGIGDGTMTSYEEAQEYLGDPETGAIQKAVLESKENHIQEIAEEDISKLLKNIDRFLLDMQSIQESNKEILADTAAVNLKALFQSVQAVEETYQEHVCPVCRTPLERTIVNPFNYARNELLKFKKIEDNQKNIENRSRAASAAIAQIIATVSKKEIAEFLREQRVDSILEASKQADDYKVLDCELSDLIRQVEGLQIYLRTDEARDRLSIYNEHAALKNRELSNKITALSEQQVKLTKKASELKTRKDELEHQRQDLAREKEALMKLESQAVAAKKEIEFNKHMREAYDSLRRKLNQYVAELPAKMAENLGEKVCSYYNRVNYGDADFDLMKSIKLPVTSSDRIMVTMHDGTAQDALQILSEGHVRVLGLSILLAKAVHEGMPFLVFDDIVNSVDDEHRSGVASLLMEHPDFSDMQMILTCHGEFFISTLESYVKKGKTVARYMFLPADSLEERGIVIKCTESSVPIKMARQKYTDGQLRDSAAKCRQAVECITSSLWKIVGKRKSGGISVQLRNLTGGPDLMAVVNGLANATKPGKMPGAEAVHDELEKLRESRSWSLLNKGTHVDETIPEFNRAEVKELLEIVERLNDATVDFGEKSKAKK